MEIQCYNCEKVGHMAKQCPEQSGGASGGFKGGNRGRC